jgi:hypothetical protein
VTLSQVVAPFVAIGIGLLLTDTRNVRFLVAAVVWWIAWFVGSTLPTPWSTASVAALGIAFGVAVLAPHAVGLGSSTRQELRADAALRRLRDKGQRDQQFVANELAVLEESLPVGSYHRLTCHLFRHAAERRLSSWGPATVTSAKLYENAASDFWKVAGWQRVLGGRRRPSVWDEDMVLRCYLEEFQRSLPPVDDTRALVSIGDEARMAGDVIAELTRLPLHHVAARQARDVLLDAMQRLLDISLGERSDAAVASYKEVAEEMAVAWRRLLTEEAPVSSAIDGG